MKLSDKNFLIIVLQVVMLLFISGCGTDKTSTSDAVTIWHWMTDKHPTFEEMAADYKAQTGTSVKFELYAPSEAYTQKVRAASQANKLPDIYGILAEKHDLASFVKAGYLEDLKPALETENNAWKNQIFEQALDHDAFGPDNEYGVEPGIYGIPIDLMTIQFVFNKEILKKAGIDNINDPFKSWNEFIEAGKKVRQTGTQFFVSGFAEPWMIDCLASNFAFNIMGEDKIIDTYRGNVPYTDPDWIQVFKLFDEMAKNDLFAPGITNFTNKEAEQMFANGRATVALNGSWCVNVYREMNPKLDYGVTLTPAFSDKFPVSVWGSAGAGLLVNSQSPRKEKAIDFLKWLTSSEQQTYFSEKTRNIPANKASLGKLSPVLAQFADGFNNSTHPSKWPIMEKAEIIEIFTKGIQLIIIGERTPEEIAKEVQAAKERLIAKQAE